MRRHFFMKALAFVVLAPLFVAAAGLVVMLLWNAVVPSVFSGPMLTFWHAVALLLLCRILFGGLRGHGGPHRWRHAAWRGRWHSMTPEERERFRDGYRRWHEMTREERQEFRRRYRGGCGPCGPGPSNETSG